MNINELAEKVQSTLEAHVESCREDEMRQVGEATEYFVDLNPVKTISGGAYDGWESLGLWAGSGPTESVRSRFGRPRQHLGRSIESRFWLRGFAFHLSPRADVVFLVQSEHGWRKGGEFFAASDDDFDQWLKKRLSTITRHISGRAIGTRL